MNSCQVRRAFGQAKPWFEGVDDLSRVIHRPDEICLLLCGAGESGWGLAFPEGTRSFLNRFESCWDRVGPEIGARWRLRCAVMGAARHFQKTMGRTDQADDWDLAGPPYATVTALLLRDGYAHCVWVGGVQVHLLSQGQLVAATVPDTLPQKLTTPCQQNNFQSLSADDDAKCIPNGLVTAIQHSGVGAKNEMASSAWEGLALLLRAFL